MPSQQQIRQEITEKIVAALEKGVKPWRRPWTISKNIGRPANAISRKPYQGINPLLLELHNLRFGFQSRWWGTFRQWSDLGCFVKKRPDDVEPGHWGCSIILYRPFKKTVENDDGDEEEHEFMLMRSFTVFNADQVEGPAAEKLQVKDEPDTGTVLPNYEPAEDLIAPPRPTSGTAATTPITTARARMALGPTMAMAITSLSRPSTGSTRSGPTTRPSSTNWPIGPR